MESSNNTIAQITIHAYKLAKMVPSYSPYFAKTVQAYVKHA